MAIDVLGDMATIIRNGVAVSKKFVFVPYSKYKHNVLKLINGIGYISGVEVVESPVEGKFGKSLKVSLKYKRGESVINEISRISTPGGRVYKNSSNLKPVCGGLGALIISTSKGIFSDAQARKLSLGGEVLFRIW